MSPQASHSSHQTATRRAARRRASLRAILLATSALASVALSATVANAGDATWNPGTADFNTGDNWTGTPDKTVPIDGTATFNASNQRQIMFSQSTDLGGITVTSGAGDYTFDTQGHQVTFGGAGLSVGSSASLTLNINGANGQVSFNGGSTAGQAQINVFGGVDQFLDFQDSSRAGQAHIINGGQVFFEGSSDAENASITSDGNNAVIFFSGQASGGKAQIALTHGGVLDISNLNGGGTTIGSLAGDSSAAVFLGSKNLAVGGNDLSTVFGGVIQDGSLGGEPGGIGGSLTKEGKGSLTLTGINIYTGTTTVNGGALIVDGSIETSSGVTVNAGGTLAGTGSVTSTTINAGGTLAPGHSDGSLGMLTVVGDLTFASANATYQVQVSPATATKTVVQKADGDLGTATLGGATVAATFAPGSYVTKQYTILTAATSISGRFNPLVQSKLSPIFTTSLSYDHNNVFLNLSAAAPGASSGLNTTQTSVATTIANIFNNSGTLPSAFATLNAAGYTQVSGETAVGTQQATFDAMNQFMGVMLDPHAGGCGAPVNDAIAPMPRKAPLKAEPFCARWGVWAAGYGGSQSTSGDSALGSNKTTSSVFGSAVGADYRFSPNTVAGFALAGGGTHFSVANGGSGNSDLFQAGAYLKHTEGAAFLSAALAYGWQDVTTNRTVTVAGMDSIRARFNTNALSGRLEGGYKVATAVGDLTPYAAAQFTTYRLPSYAEQVVGGTNTFALGYSGKDVTATRSELGLRSEKAIMYADSTLMLRGRLAWAHDFNTDRNVAATFLALPGSGFVVNGASPAADTALTTISAEMLWRNGWSASATADAQLSDTTHNYSGKGVVRYSW
jgi:autotransporter-associated beta strand protein